MRDFGIEFENMRVHDNRGLKQLLSSEWLFYRRDTMHITAE